MAVTDKSPVRARLDHLLAEIASAAPAPASGSAAAAVVATAAALLQKVALRSKGRWTGATAAHDRAEAIMVRAEELIELDTLAYLEFVEATRLGGNAEAARLKTIEVPADIVGYAAAVIDLARELEANGNPNLRADAVAAAILAEAAAMTAAMLVEVNESAGRGAARGRAGDRDRAGAQSPGTDRPSRRRTARAAPTAPSADRLRASSRSRAASSGSRSTRPPRRRGESR
ncbi:MAG: cyclodeaminase/cyclohydrolase family protein [Chloroflexi bacterium]|nr:MAG: cyclodeaminase/cyclohydrolase family protein [Chloroflexota bacterium]